MDISLIPAVIFKENLKDSDKYKEYSSIFKEKDNYFILSESAANSNYFINREEIKNKIEVFLKKDEASSLKAEKNMEEFLKTFNKIEFKKYYVDSNNELIKELKINTFPTFLLNNKLKFSGIIPAETIKENFCSMNDLEECKVRLSSKLI